MENQRLRILLAADHMIVAEGIRRLLESEYDLLETAVDGSDLVEAAIRLKPDLIVSDVSMPSLSGIESLQHIRGTIPR